MSLSSNYRLQAQLAEAHSLLNENELLLQEREEQIERTKSQLLPSKDIDSLKKQILENQQSIGNAYSTCLSNILYQHYSIVSILCILSFR